MIQALKQGLERFNGKMRGFVTQEAKLIGVETRTASPVRVIRDHETRQAAGIAGLYPMGEGMGYGGGIASAAIDGMRSADLCLASLMWGRRTNHRQINSNIWLNSGLC